MSNLSCDSIVLDKDGNQIGRMTTNDAKKLANSQGLDLVEISNKDGLSVVKIMDRGKWLYEQKKHNKKKTHASQKEMQFSVRIDPHDLQVKIGKVQKFLDKGISVRLVIEMRGREKTHSDIARDLFDSIIGSLLFSRYDPAKSSGSQITTVIYPHRKDS